VRSCTLIGRILARVVAVLAAAALTLAAIIALVRGTIIAVSITNLSMRILAVGADLLLGTVLLMGCLYLATRLAVRIVGVGDTNFPPLPEDTRKSGALFRD
jgi:hypothetical protein